MSGQLGSWLIINLVGLPGSTISVALGVNSAGQAVGISQVGGIDHPVEWTSGSVVDLGVLPGSPGGDALAINDAGQIVGVSEVVGVLTAATEWNGGNIIDLGPLAANAINDAGQVVGFGPLPIPEPSTWAMMLLGFAGLGYVGYRKARQA
jgi:probable HAF family extracellular repeat protein